MKDYKIFIEAVNYTEVIMYISARDENHAIKQAKELLEKSPKEIIAVELR